MSPPPDWTDAFSDGNPAVVLFRMLRDDPESRKALAARLWATTDELDEASFARAALMLERPEGTT